MRRAFDYVKVTQKDGRWSLEGYLVSVSCGIGILAGEKSNSNFCVDDVVIELLVAKEAQDGAHTVV